MGTVHATMNISLDGCCDHTQVVADDEFHERVSVLFDRAAALLFGRTTFDMLHGHWPGVASSGIGSRGALRLAGILQRKPKFVVSSRPVAPDWNAQAISLHADALEALRDETDGTMLLVGSPMLARTLVRSGLIDEYHVAMSPLVAGHGPYFLAGCEGVAAPKLLDVDRLRSGVLFLRYALGAPLKDG